MATMDKQEEIFNALTKVEHIAHGMRGMFQNDLQGVPKNVVNEMINDFNNDYELLKSTIIDAKNKANEFVKSYIKEGYKGPTRIQRNHTEAKPIDTDDLPF